MTAERITPGDVGVIDRRFAADADQFVYPSPPKGGQLDD
jgi:hypothetical protein